MNFDYNKTREWLIKQKACNACLGRQFHGLFKGDNVLIGAAVRKTEDQDKVQALIDKQKTELDKKCPFCQGMFLQTEELGNKASELIQNFDFDSFLVGVRVPKALTVKEEEMWSEIGAAYCEPLKKDLKRKIGLQIEKNTGKTVEFKIPDITLLIDFNKEPPKIKLDLNALFIYGEYSKNIRGIPQTKWYCRECHGKGCGKCNFTGKMYETSVEEIIAKSVLAITGGSTEKFHGCIHPSSQITLADNSITSMKELAKSWKKKNILTYGSGVHATEIEDFVGFDSNTLKIIKLETKETGRTIIASRDHIFFTPQGKKVAASLKVGSRVAVLPSANIKHKRTRELILADNTNIQKIAYEYASKPHINKHLKILENAGLLPLTTYNPNILKITRLLAFLFGDGNVHYTRNRDVALFFYENLENLKSIQKDLESIGFKSSYRKRKTNSIVLDYHGKARRITGEGYELACNSKALWLLMVALGAPVGDKVTKDMFVPKWVFSDDLIKIEFLASLFGAEMSKPRLDKRKYNKKSFNTPIFSMNKIEKNLENGKQFLQDICQLLADFDIETSNIRVIPYTTRKDGNKSMKLRIDLLNKQENLLKLYGTIGFRYCKEKEKLGRYAFEYLSMKQKVLTERKKVLKKAVELKKAGKTVAEINKELAYTQIPRQHLWSYLTNKMKIENTKVPNTFPNYPDWKTKSISGLKDGLVWETISKTNKSNSIMLMDLTTKSDSHCFFANGFLVSNSGREDIDALMIGGRPFVMEIINPIKRDLDFKALTKQINTQDKVTVKALRKSTNEEMRLLKTLKYEKTYEVEITTEKTITKKILEQIEKEFKNREISQRTPTRVAHRRADLVRKRKILFVKCEKTGGKSFKATLKTASGTYIKELVSSDEGRTKPAFSDYAGPCKVDALNVLEVHKREVM
ncbi:tRNA pseudouridine(54/55) synthase Pus10 [archaeon]|nr:tRNA pseudouridine(54/55) synthase Pus10 [archaeon]